MAWREHLRTEEQLFEKGVDRLRVIIPEMKDTGLWIPIRVIEDYLGYSFQIMDKKLETIRELEADGQIEEIIGPIRWHIMDNSQGVPYVSFITPMIAVKN